MVRWNGLILQRSFYDVLVVLDTFAFNGSKFFELFFIQPILVDMSERHEHVVPLSDAVVRILVRDDLPISKRHNGRLIAQRTPALERPACSNCPVSCSHLR